MSIGPELVVRPIPGFFFVAVKLDLLSAQAGVRRFWPRHPPPLCVLRIEHFHGLGFLCAVPLEAAKVVEDAHGLGILPLTPEVSRTCLKNVA